MDQGSDKRGEKRTDSGVHTGTGITDCRDAADKENRGVKAGWVRNAADRDREQTGGDDTKTTGASARGNTSAGRRSGKGHSCNHAGDNGKESCGKGYTCQ